jgi:hypothetical protein
VKLRIKGDSLRLRLTQGEVHSLALGERVEERTRFGSGQVLVYRLCDGGAAAAAEVSFTGGVLEVRLPPAELRAWCAGEGATFEASLPHEEGVLRLLVEKDFACLKPRVDEDESDHFPHPEAASGRHDC